MKFDKTDLTKIVDTDWARMAAYLDGEGHVLINMYGKNRKGFAQHYLRIVITNTDPRLVIWCAQTFGGSVLLDKHNARQKPQNRLTYRWMASCRVACEILRGCLPYLITKNDQAQLCIAFQDSIRPVGGQRKLRLTPSEINFRHECREKLLAMRMERYKVPEFEELRMSFVNEQVN